MLQADDAPALGCEQNKHVVRRLYEEVFGEGRLERADQLRAPRVPRPPRSTGPTRPGSR